MSENGLFEGFGEIFDITPKEKKRSENSTKKEKKETKNGAKSKKKTEKEYDLPIQIYTEWGLIDLIGDGKPHTLKEIGNMMPVPQTVTEKNGVFVGTFSSMSVLKKTDIVKGKLFNSGNFVEIDAEMTAEDVLKKYPMFSEKMKVYKIKKDLYVARYPDDMAANWNLKVRGSCCVGFKGSDMLQVNPDEPNKEYTLKEAVETFNKSNSWTSCVEKFYIFDKIGDVDTITVQLTTQKVESKTLSVKLPCKIRFLHDEGPLSGGLTSDMFDGKEYVTDKEILKLVDKYFPQIYQEKNTVVSYIENVNTVCVLHIGRTKGCDKIETGAGIFFLRENNGLEYVSLLPPIPLEILLEVEEYFREELPTEAIVQIIYDKKDAQYKVFKPDSVKMLAKVSWSDFETLNMLKESDIVVMEIHSHNTMNAFFSAVDDSDETLPMLYGVMGRLDEKHGRIKIRAGAAGRFVSLNMKQVFEMPIIIKNEQSEFTRLAENKHNGIFRNIRSGEYVLAKGIEYYPDGSISWDYGRYFGSDFFNIDWNYVLSQFVENISGEVLIREVLEKTVKIEEGESVFDIKNRYNDEKIILDSSDFKETYFLPCLKK